MSIIVPREPDFSVGKSVGESVTLVAKLLVAKLLDLLTLACNTTPGSILASEVVACMDLGEPCSALGLQ